MKSKCDHCEKLAVVHETTVRDGVKNEMHLCAEHAAEHGFEVATDATVPPFLAQFVVCKSETRPKVSRKTCRTCGLSFRTFRQTGLLGCPDCYEAFEEQIVPMIERAQGGGTSHSGKFPKRCAESLERQLRIQRLVRELKHAVDAEDYERAAQLRDRLRSLDSTDSGGPGGGASRPTMGTSGTTGTSGASGASRE